MGLSARTSSNVVTADIGIIQAIGQFDTASEGTLSLLETGARVILAAAGGFDMQSVRHEIQRSRRGRRRTIGSGASSPG